MLNTLVTLFGISLWPIALYSANIPPDFFTYTIPALLLAISYFLFIKEKSYSFSPLLAIPFFEPKLAIFPLLFSTILLIWKRDKLSLTFLVLSLVALIVNAQSFYGQTIIVPDYEARQEVIRNTQLYDSIFMARLLHNKLRIIFDKFISNLFALTDPGNYFFGFHPRQIIGNQNLTKYPFLGVVFLIYGFFFGKKGKAYKFVLYSLVSAIVSLSLLSTFDRNDFILWIPLSVIFVKGVQEFKKEVSLSKIYFFVFLVYSFPELVRAILFG